MFLIVHVSTMIHQEEVDSFSLSCQVLGNRHSYTVYSPPVKCDWILENSSKSHMKYYVFMHVFNDISINAYIFLEYFKNFKNEFHKILWNMYNTIHVAVTNITNYKSVIWNYVFSKIQSQIILLIFQYMYVIYHCRNFCGFIFCGWRHPLFDN